MTMELRFTNLGPGTLHPIQGTLRTFPASREPRGIGAWYGLVSPTDVRATCTATDALSMTASRTMDILYGCGGGWCSPRE